MRHKDNDLQQGKEFVERNRAKMRRIACAELEDKGCEDPAGHAEDIASDVCIKLLTLWPLYSPAGAIYTFTVNGARTHARTCRREFAFEIREDQVPVFSQPSNDPEVMLEHMELVDWALSHLNEKEARVLTMRFMVGMSFTTIADCIDSPLGTVTSIYSRAISKLKKALEAEQKAAVLRSRTSPSET